MTKSFNKYSTNVIKGFSTLILISHHIFEDCDILSDSPSLRFIFPHITFYLQKYGYISIFIFSFISGYGMFFVQKRNSGKYWIQREIKLLGSFIPVYFLGIILRLIDRRSFSLIEETYGSSYSALPHMLLDMSGLSALFGTGTINVTWWYMSAAHLIIAFCALSYLISDISKLRNSDICLMIPVIYMLLRNTKNPTYYCVLASYLGITACKYNLFEKARIFEEKYNRILLSAMVITVFSCLSVAMDKIVSSEKYGYYIPTLLYMPFLLFFINYFVVPLKYINTSLAFIGKHSSFIFMFHTFLYFYLSFSRTFMFSLKYALLAFIYILGLSITASATVEAIEKATGYKSVINKLVELFH